jgi:preprotein translocase subunit SecE
VQKNNSMNKVVNYIAESFEELKANVSWPTWEETQKYAIIVAIFSVVFSLSIWGVDKSFEKVIAIFFNWIKS